MKRLLCCAVMALIFVVSYGQSKPVEINQSLEHFNAIEVAFGYDVTIHKSDSYSAKVTVDPSLAEYVNVSVKNGSLYVGMDEKGLSSDLKKLWNSRKYAGLLLKVDIYVPSYNRLVLSGKSALNKSQSVVSSGNFSLVMEDNSFVSDLSVEATSFDLRMCNKSSAKLDVKAIDCNIENSNSSSLELKAEGDSLNLSLSGLSKSDIIASFSNVNLNTAGSSTVDIEGSAEYLAANCAGSSSVKAEPCKVDSAMVKLSGSSKCYVDVQALLQVDLSGSSHLYFGSNPVIKIDRISNSSMIRLVDVAK